MINNNSFFRYAKELGCTWTPGMSMTNGSEGSLGKETLPSAVTAVTRNRYKIPDYIYKMTFMCPSAQLT